MKNLYTVISLLLPFLVNAQEMDIVWQSCFLEGYPTSTINKTSNGYYFAIRVEDGDIGGRDIRLIKYDQHNSAIWQKDFGGSETEGPVRLFDVSDGCIILAYTHSSDGDINSNLNGDSDAWVFKIDYEGNVLWSHTYGGTTQFEEVRDFVLTPDGGFVLMIRFSGAGGDISTEYGGGGDIWLCKSDSTGIIEWEKTLGGPGMENCYTLTLTSENHIIACGLAAMHGDLVECYPEGWGDAWVVELDLSGNIVSKHCYGGSYYDAAHQIIETDDGYILVGVTSSNDGDVSGFHGIPGAYGHRDIWIIKLNNQFEIEWQKCLGGTESDYGYYISLNENGGFTVIGDTKSHDGDVVSENHSDLREDIWVVNLNSEGNIIWEHCYGGLERESLSFRRVIKKNDYHYIISGTSNYKSGDVECGNFDVLDYDIWLFELKDCDHYQTSIPATPTGADTLCVQDSIAYFTTGAVEFADHYAWLVSPPEAGTITGDSLQATYHINPAYQGTAAITVKAVNDCGQSDWSEPKYVEIQNCLGIQDNPYAALLRVYPNPANDYVIFTLNTTQPVKTKITVTDLFGQEIANFPLKKQKTKWNLKGLAKGVYFYHSVVEGENVFGKIIVR